MHSNISFEFDKEWKLVRVFHLNVHSSTCCFGCGLSSEHLYIIFIVNTHSRSKSACPKQKLESTINSGRHLFNTHKMPQPDREKNHVERRRRLMMLIFGRLSNLRLQLLLLCSGRRRKNYNQVNYAEKIIYDSSCTVLKRYALTLTSSLPLLLSYQFSGDHHQNMNYLPMGQGISHFGKIFIYTHTP